jgi:hypothetical protein
MRIAVGVRHRISHSRQLFNASERTNEVYPFTITTSTIILFAGLFKF